jgi:hypothetical protein
LAGQHTFICGAWSLPPLMGGVVRKRRNGLMNEDQGQKEWLRRPGGSAPWTPDGVPPLSLALRGRSLLSANARRKWAKEKWCNFNGINSIKIS